MAALPGPKSGAGRRSAADHALISKNAGQFLQAIRQRQKVQVQYRSPKGQKRFSLAPLDIKPGRGATTKGRRYMWGYSESRETVLCLHLDKVVDVKPLKDEAFDPIAVSKAWENKTVVWM